MHKKWIALLLAGLVICNLSACGNGNSDQNISQGNEYSSTGDQGNQIRMHRIKPIRQAA